MIVAAGCDESSQFRGRIDPDVARVCAPDDADAGDLPGCGTGEVCIEGRCYQQCSTDGDCGPGEACSSSGACVVGTSMRDAGPPDPCAMVSCTSPQVCHPASGTCTTCSERTVNAADGEPGACSDPAVPVCDIANGACVAAAAAQCTPCNSDAECANATTGFAGTCVTQDVMGVHEQVCLQTCTDTCPTGLVCTGGHCLPAVGVPCANWLAAVNRTSCLSDGACAPLGAVSAVYPGACEGEDTTTGLAGVCLQPCGDSTHCFNATGGQTCTGTEPELFCRP